MAYGSNATTDLSRDGRAIASGVHQDFSNPGRLIISVKASLSGTEASDAGNNFRKWERKWKRDTQFVSSLSDKYLHECYARIMGMGPCAIPLILKSLTRQPDDWFYALRAISGENPVRATDAGNVAKMASVWIEWGRQRGLI